MNPNNSQFHARNPIERGDVNKTSVDKRFVIHCVLFEQIKRRRSTLEVCSHMHFAGKVSHRLDRFMKSIMRKFAPIELAL